MKPINLALAILTLLTLIILTINISGIRGNLETTQEMLILELEGKHIALIEQLEYHDLDSTTYNKYEMELRQIDYQLSNLEDKSPYYRNYIKNFY